LIGCTGASRVGSDAVGHDWLVPDDLDYRWLAELIASPEEWTLEMLASAEAMVVDQKQAVSEAHPAEIDRLQAVVTELESAIQRYRHHNAG
jgi:hypothetical protein